MQGFAMIMIFDNNGNHDDDGYHIDLEEPAEETHRFAMIMIA